MRVGCVVLDYAPQDGEGMWWWRGDGGGENALGLVAPTSADELADSPLVEYSLVGVLRRPGGIGGSRARQMWGLDGQIVGACSELQGERGGGSWIAVV